MRVGHLHAKSTKHDCRFTEIPGHAGFIEFRIQYYEQRNQLLSKEEKATLSLTAIFLRRALHRAKDVSVITPVNTESACSRGNDRCR